MKVAVYWNLHKACWSIQCREGADYGRVIAHAKDVALEGVRFTVSEAGRQRVLATKRKNVHAFVVGVLLAYHRLDDSRVRVTFAKYYGAMDTAPATVSYNPYKGPAFCQADLQGEWSRCDAAKAVYMTPERKVLAWEAA